MLASSFADFWFSAGEADHRMHEIGARYHSNDLLPAHDGHTLDATALHQFDDVFKARVFGDGVNLRGHDFGNLAAMRMGVLDSKPAGTHEEFEPARMSALGRGLPAAEEIALGQNADKLSALVNHGQTADAMLKHLPRCLKDRGIGLHRDDGAGHYISGFHGNYSNQQQKYEQTARTMLTQIKRPFEAEKPCRPCAGPDEKHRDGKSSCQAM